MRYVLEGSIRREGAQVRINVQLVDGISAANLWADHFEDGVSHIFAFRDRITERVATIVEPAIEIAEIRRSRRDRPNSPAVYDLYLRALAAITDESIESNAAAYTLLREALTIEPENALILSLAAWRSNIARPWAGRCSEKTTRRNASGLHAAASSIRPAIPG